MRAINEYIRGDASLYLEWKITGFPLRFDEFNSTLIKDFRDKKMTEDTLKLVRKRTSVKIEEIDEMGSQLFKELSNNQNNISYSILRRKKHSGNGFKSFEFRSKELLVKLQLKTKYIFSETISQIRKFGKKGVQKCINFARKTWFQILIGYLVFSIISGFFQALFNIILSKYFNEGGP